MSQKLFVQYGAGNIGRGFIGHVFSEAGYTVCFIDVNTALIERINRDHRYPITIVEPDGDTDLWVENVYGVHGADTPAVMNAIAHADLMATAVGVHVFPKILPMIAEGLRQRWANQNFAPFNIIICENLLDADVYMHRALSALLSPAEQRLFNTHVGLSEASIGRMVPVMTEAMQRGNPLRVCVERYGQLPIDKAAFKGPLPQIPNVHPFAPFEYFIRRKLFVHNMGHALVAYLGAREHHCTIGQAMRNPVIKLIAQRAMTEAAYALARHFSIPLHEILDHISDLLLRFSNERLGDTVARVGRDTLRKLSKNDRFIATIQLCETEGITPIYISIGLAAGLLFENPDDPGTAMLRDQVSKNGPESTLASVCDLQSGSTREQICAYYMKLQQGSTLEEILAEAESLHAKILTKRKII
jgi:mannitol-1-phosphate 5-dehydrogenase